MELQNVLQQRRSIRKYKQQPVEKEKIDILKKMQKTLVLADDVSHRLCDSSNVVVRVSAPFIDGAQIATHLPLLGEKGTDFLLETIEAYYQTLA